MPKPKCPPILAESSFFDLGPIPSAMLEAFKQLVNDFGTPLVTKCVFTQVGTACQYAYIGLADDANHEAVLLLTSMCAHSVNLFCFNNPLDEGVINAREIAERWKAGK